MSNKLCHEYGFNEMDYKQKLQVLTYMQDAINKGATSVIMDGRLFEGGTNQ